MATKVKSYRINITDDVQEGDAIVIGQDGGMVSCHLGTVSSLDTGTAEGNVPVLGPNGELPSSTAPSSVMKKSIYDPNNKSTNVFDYCNLDNKPAIPVVNDPVVTFTQGGVTVGSISLNQAGPTTIGLLSGGVTSGEGITIAGNNVSVSYDSNSLGIDTCNKLNVKNYDTIASGAAAGATAVQADDLATVAMTGNYCDLINKPDIPSAQVQSDWDEINTNLPQYIKNKPTIGNATITLQKNGTNVDCFELNQTANKCLNLTLNKCDVGLNNVDNTSDADKPISDATQCALNCKQDSISDLNTIRSNACAGKTASETIANYGDIVNHNVCEFATAAQGGKADSAVQPGDLCTVATSAQYCDLIGQPTIPTDNSQLANGCGYITNAVNNLTNYYLKCETYQKCEVDNLIANFGGFEVVATLPTQNIKTNVIYLKGPIGAGTDRYEEWIYYNNTWTLIGETSTDLSNYAKCSDIPTNNNQLANGCGYTTCTGTLVASDLTPYAKTCNLCTVATSGKYCDLTGRPSLCAVATSAKYCDLTGTPVLCNVATSGAYTDLSGTPTLSTVATSGCYNDLTGKPTIPTDNCQLGNSCNYITKSVNNLDNYTPTTSLATVATSGAYCDLTGKPTLACVACTGCYDDLSGKPNLGVYQTTANMVCTLSGADHSHYPSAKTVADALSCAGAGDMLSTVYDPNGKQADAFDYNNFINTPLLCSVATSGKYCDLTGLPTIPAALSAGNGICISSNCINVLCDNSTIKKNSNNTLYADFSGLATTASLCPVATSGCYDDLTGKPTIPTNNNQLTNGCGYTTCTGTVVASDLNAYTKNCDLATVATSGQYCDLSGTPSIPATLSSGTGICIDDNNKVNAKNHYIINEDAYDVTYTGTLGVSPYNTCYCYTNVCINPNCGIKWEEGATYMFNIDTKVATSKCRNVRLKIGDSEYIPLMGTTASIAGNSYFVKSSIRPFQYSTKYIACGALHMITDSNTTYSAMTQAEIDAGTSTTARSITPANLKYAIEYYSPTDNCQLANGCGYITSSALSGYAQSCDLCTVATTGLYCDLTGVPAVPTDNCQLANGCGYTTCIGTVVASDLNAYATNTSLCAVAKSGKYCDLTGQPSLCTVATSGKYCDLTGQPTIPTNNNQLTNGCGYTTCIGTVVASDLNAYAKTNTLCTVATSGKYCDLTGTPTIPTNNNQLANGCGYTTCTGTISNCAGIISALGYTPYNATNPSGYTTCTGTLTQSAISDDAFSSSWSTDTTHAPSKKAIYNVLGDVETLLASI